MKKIFFAVLFAALFLPFGLCAEELKIKADYFESDQNKGVSLFKGNVHITKGFDEINASKVTIYTDKERNPIKFIAEGDVKFRLEDSNKKKYSGVAQKVVYFPNKKEYRFYKDVYLYQIGEKKEIRGDEVVFSAISGKSYAKGVDKNPVIMIFNLEEKEKKEK